jgi:CheY-like chemotaxis protein
MKVLIVDDEPLIRRSLQRAFEKQGHQVVTAPDAFEGLDLWLRDDPDVCLVDVIMPKMTGPELIKKMGESRRSKVVLMTAFSGDNESVVQVQYDLFLRKPFEDIMKVIKQVEELVCD